MYIRGVVCWFIMQIIWDMPKMKWNFPHFMPKSWEVSRCMPPTLPSCIRAVAVEVKQFTRLRIIEFFCLFSYIKDKSDFIYGNFDLWPSLNFVISKSKISDPLLVVFFLLSKEYLVNRLWTYWFLRFFSTLHSTFIAVMY